eukprot:TRINITY_DN13652_c0_g4_i1.p1 TRINITY_DN13652_c0_g4~~TRINITY_DN13652_c0_g4_i1.p1  ORF type:complete len:896 (+),score=147.42 TRINITY_DN13652_c0_g4_i1:24-2711(+)
MEAPQASSTQAAMASRMAGDPLRKNHGIELPVKFVATVLNSDLFETCISFLPLHKLQHFLASSREARRRAFPSLVALLERCAPASGDCILAALRNPPCSAFERPKWAETWNRVAKARLNFDAYDEESEDRWRWDEEEEDEVYQPPLREQWQDAIRVALAVGLKEAAKNALDMFRVHEFEAISELCFDYGYDFDTAKDMVESGPLYDAVINECKLCVGTTYVPCVKHLRPWLEAGAKADQQVFCSLAHSRANPAALKNVFKLLLQNGADAQRITDAEDAGSEHCILQALRRPFSKSLPRAQWRALWQDVAKETFWTGVLEWRRISDEGEDSSDSDEDELDFDGIADSAVVALAAGFRGYGASAFRGLAGGVVKHVAAMNRTAALDLDEEPPEDALWKAVRDHCARVAQGSKAKPLWLRAWLAAATTQHPTTRHFRPVEALMGGKVGKRPSAQLVQCLSILADHGAFAGGEVIVRALATGASDAAWSQSWELIAHRSLRWAVTEAMQSSSQPQSLLEVQVAALVAAMTLPAPLPGCSSSTSCSAGSFRSGILEQCQASLRGSGPKQATSKLIDWLCPNDRAKTTGTALSVDLLQLFAESSQPVQALLEPVSYLVSHGAGMQGSSVLAVLQRNASDENTSLQWRSLWRQAALAQLSKIHRRLEAEAADALLDFECWFDEHDIGDSDDLCATAAVLSVTGGLDMQTLRRCLELLGEGPVLTSFENFLAEQCTTSSEANVAPNHVWTQSWLELGAQLAGKRSWLHGHARFDMHFDVTPLSVLARSSADPAALLSVVAALHHHGDFAFAEEVADALERKIDVDAVKRSWDALWKDVACSALEWILEESNECPDDVAATEFERFLSLGVAGPAAELARKKMQALHDVSSASGDSRDAGQRGY